MIIDMKKVVVVLQHKDLETGLQALRDSGVVHVEHVRQPKGHHLQMIHDQIQNLERALLAIEPYKDLHEQKRVINWSEKSDEINQWLNEIDIIQEDIRKQQALIKQWSVWGNFHPADIEYLQQHGIFVRFYEAPLKSLGAVPEDVIVERIAVASGLARIVVISERSLDLPYTEIKPPAYGLKQMQEQLAAEERKLKVRQESIKEAGKYYASLFKVLAERQQGYEFEEIRAGAGEEEHLAYLQGFCPKDQVDKFSQTARLNRWAYTIADPADDDQVPTLIRSPKWANIVKPVFDFASIIPGYREFDISNIFVFFFTLFFAMLIGDAAYGLLFLAVTLFFHVKMNARVKDKTPFFLLYVLSVSTIIWGILTGTFFGQEWLPEYINPAVPWLNEVENIQWLCFLIGAIHLSVAHAWKIITYFPSLRFLQELGWLTLVWAMFFLANMFVLGHDLPPYIYVLGIGGAALIVLFPKPRIDPLMPLTVVNYFTDVVSYIRLFAVGLATVAVADAANNMSLFWVIFLHTLNIILAWLAILVHALRLNTLEFSSHLGVEWGGYAYRPFAKVKTS